MKKAYLLTLIITIILHSSSRCQDTESFFGELNTVVIDAGHGGKDKGCLGSSSYEKDIALGISLKLGKYLEEKFDHLKVIYTRKTDIFLELDERAKIANRNKADLFICIHANAASSSAFGTETFVMGNAKTETNLRAAQRENAAILLEDNYEERYENFDPNSPESYIALTIMQSAFQNQSISFAQKVQSQFRERVGRKDRGVKMAPFLVLHQTTMPSVLIETGFLSNASEESFLKSELGQDYLASAIYRAFKEYKDDIETKSKLLIAEESIDLKISPSKEKEENQPPKEILKEGKEEANENVKKEPVKEQPSNRIDKGEGLYFKVQLATTTNKIDPSPANFKGLQGVSYYEAGGLFRYTYGKEDSWEMANKIQEKVRESGFEDSFVIAFLDGKRIAVGEAVKLLKQKR